MEYKADREYFKRIAQFSRLNFRDVPTKELQRNYLWLSSCSIRYKGAMLRNVTKRDLFAFADECGALASGIAKVLAARVSAEVEGAYHEHDCYSY